MSHALEAHHLVKTYYRGEFAPYDTLRDWLTGRRRSHRPQFRAVDDVSFTLAPGERLGLVGGNGAGKSTLLKILSRITRPTSGEALIRGRVGALLEVGAGFHAELTGRENIFLYGAILGMSRAEIRRHLDEIIAFSELDASIDTAVKHYSTGMFMRLAFAVAAHLRTEVLFVDEVLSVGDAAFQRKCLDKMGELSTEQGRTILFVSHNLAAVRALCTRALHLDHGRLLDDGAPDAVIRGYLSTLEAAADTGRWRNPDDRATGPVRIESAQLCGPDGSPVSTIPPDDDAGLQIRYGVAAPTPGVALTFRLLAADGTIVWTDVHEVQPPAGGVVPAGEHLATVGVPTGLLNAGSYLCLLGIATTASERPALHPALRFRVLEAADAATTAAVGVIRPRLDWQTTLAEAS